MEHSARILLPKIVCRNAPLIQRYFFPADATFQVADFYLGKINRIKKWLVRFERTKLNPRVQPPEQMKRQPENLNDQTARLSALSPQMRERLSTRLRERMGGQRNAKERGRVIQM